VHAHLPQSRLRWVDSGGHNPFEPDMAQALVQALAHFAAHANFLGWGQSFHPIELS
jgi:proline iminopeptidase